MPSISVGREYEFFPPPRSTCSTIPPPLISRLLVLSPHAPLEYPKTPRDTRFGLLREHLLSYVLSPIPNDSLCSLMPSLSPPDPSPRLPREGSWKQKRGTRQIYPPRGPPAPT